MYFNDYNDWLPPGKGARNPPGPAVNYGLTQGQLPVYSANSNTRKWLPYYLASYLSLPDAANVPAASNMVVKVFVCAAYKSAVGSLSDGASGRSTDNPEENNYTVAQSKSGAGSYTVQQASSSTKYMAMLKAAYPNGVNAVVAGGTVSWLPFGKEHTYEPMRLSQISGAGVPLSEFWEIGDYDVPATGAAKFDMAVAPVHKSARNFSYFDGHVGSRNVPPDGKYDQ
jgi:prepilin-type processing-associated H-X9-DG protein